MPHRQQQRWEPIRIQHGSHPCGGSIGLSAAWAHMRNEQTARMFNVHAVPYPAAQKPPSLS